MMNTRIISEFRDEYFFLSNFHDNTPVEFEGLMYRNSEAAFQSAKSLDKEIRKKFCNMNPSDAKKEGYRVKLRGDWESIKDDIMLQIVRDKFTRHPELREKLLATGNKLLVEGNTWGDDYWGVYKGKGKNKLGMILMQVRDELKNN